jgi:hypothetical protein
MYFICILVAREGVMNFIWILVGLPIVSLLCVAFVAVRDGKVALANGAVRRAPSVSGIAPLAKVNNGGDWNSESMVQVLIGILSNSNDDGFRVTIRQFESDVNDRAQESMSLAKNDDKAWTRSKSEICTLKRCKESLFLDEDSSHLKLDRSIENRGISRTLCNPDFNSKKSEMTHPTVDPGTSVRPT